MFQSFGRLALGLILAIVLVYLLLATLLQSWLDPLIIMIAIPGALIGVLWMLMVTGTTINVESLMGTIMVVGIAVSNSNLLVNFANDLRAGEQRELSAVDAAVQAGKTRLRPVLMTAIAMLLGMLPMALALGEGGEQNAPLGRAVIGGLLVATFVTLFAVPIVYSLLRKAAPRKQTMDAEFEKEIADESRAPRRTMADTAETAHPTPLLPEHVSDASGAEAPRNEPAPGATRQQRVVLYVVVACLIVIPILGVLFFTHRRHTREAEQAQAAEVEQKKGPPVLLAKVSMTPPHRTVTLPADTRAVLSTTLYAKTSGFVVEMRTDKGFRCKRGDILALLQSPEVDQQVLAARADMDVKSRAAARNDELAKNGLVSEQDREAALGNAQTAAAALRQAQVIKGYEQIRAPFDGVVTARYVESGRARPGRHGLDSSRDARGRRGPDRHDSGGGLPGPRHRLAGPRERRREALARRAPQRHLGRPDHAPGRHFGSANPHRARRNLVRQSPTRPSCPASTCTLKFRSRSTPLRSFPMMR